MTIWTRLTAAVLPPPSIPVISVGNLKGGVGKTTVVANLAWALTLKKLRVLAIDLDFQASLTVAFPPQVVPRQEGADGGINILLGESYDLFHDARVAARGIGQYSDLTLIGTSFALAEIEDQLFAAYILAKHPEDPRFALARKLMDRRLKNDFDLVLIDTPPRLTIASINALCASSHVIIPTALSPLAYSGARTFATLLTEFKQHLCPRLDILGVLPTFTRSELNEAERKAIEQAKRDLPGVPIWDKYAIPRRQAFADNKSFADSESKENFSALAEEIIKTLGIGTHDNDPNRRSDRRTQSNWRMLS